jgi:hypothetical protein
MPMKASSFYADAVATVLYPNGGAARAAASSAMAPIFDQVIQAIKDADITISAGTTANGVTAGAAAVPVTGTAKVSA